jgi:DNA-directed RNA polymerase subunit RPC12/RpoP
VPKDESHQRLRGDFELAGNNGHDEAAPPKYVRVVSDDVGQTIRCPVCNTPAVIKAPNAGRPAKPFSLPEEHYRLVEGSSQPRADSREAYGEYFAINCPRCGTLLRPKREEAGQEIECPDCNKIIAVPEWTAKKRRSIVNRSEAIEGYELGRETRAASDAGNVDPGWGFDDEESHEAGSARRRPIVYEKPEPPDRPFLTGIYTFPFYAGTWPRWVTLSVFGTIILLMAIRVLKLILVGGHIWIMAMLLGAAAALLAIIWTILASVISVSVIEETAAGNDRIESWPDLMFLDWFLESLYIVNAATLTAAGCIGVVRAGAALSVPWEISGILAGALGLALFPTLCMSMMEAGSPMMPISVPVLRSWFAATWGWIIFLFQSVFIWALLAGFQYLVVTQIVGNTPIQALSSVRTLSATSLLMLGLTAAMLVYARLLGRLGWYFSETMVLPELGEDKTAERDMSESIV